VRLFVASLSGNSSPIEPLFFIAESIINAREESIAAVKKATAEGAFASLPKSQATGAHKKALMPAYSAAEGTLKIVSPE